MRDRGETQEIAERTQRTLPDGESEEQYDRAEANERSRRALRAAFPGLDRERHAELDAQRRSGQHSSTSVQRNPTGAASSESATGASEIALLDQASSAERTAEASSPAVQRQEDKPAGSSKSDAAKHEASNAPSAAHEPEPNAIDFAKIIARVEQANELMSVIRSTLLPTYRNAVDTLDPIHALELARHCVGSFEVIQAAADLLQAAGVQADGAPASPEKAKLAFYHLQFSSHLTPLQDELAVQLSPQVFRNRPVLGSHVRANLGRNPAGYLSYEAGTTVELLSAFKQVQHVAGASSGTCPVLSAAQRATVVNLVEPWKSRPVNFAFLQHVLFDEGIWQAVAGERGTMSGKTLDSTSESVTKQTRETGALADVGVLDVDTLETLLAGLPETSQPIFDKLRTVAPNARGKLVRQIWRSGKLTELLELWPRNHIKALHAALAPHDPELLATLKPYLDENEGGGRSMHRIYMDQVDTHLATARAPDATKAEHLIHVGQAFGWFWLDTAHDALTGGFQREYSAAYDQYQQGDITKDEFRSQATKALGKAAVITAAAAITGGAAGELASGFASGLRAGRTAAQLISGVAGGAASGAGGHLAGDIYDQALNGKDGFDSIDQYLTSAGVGAASGAVLSSLSIGAGRYLPESQQRMIDTYAGRYPRMTKVLEALHETGYRGGMEVRAAGNQTATVVKLKVKELLDLIDSGFGGPGTPGSFALADGGDLRALPPNTELSVALRPTRPLHQPMQTSTPGKKGDGSGGEHPTSETEQPVVAVERVELAKAEADATTGKTGEEGASKTEDTDAKVSVSKGANEAKAADRGLGLRGPAQRHDLRRVKQGTVAKDLNTVVEPGVDVVGDVAAINQGLARRVGETFEINGRTYGVHDGTLFPISGPGFHQLNRGAFHALGVLNKFGDTPQTHAILGRMKNVGPDEVATATMAWKAGQ